MRNTYGAAEDSSARQVPEGSSPARNVEDGASQRIEQLLKQQMAVNELGRLLGSTLDLTELCRIAHREIEKIVGFTNLGISTYDATTQQIRALFIIADGEFIDVSQLPSIPLEPGTGPQSRAITTHLPDIIDDMVIERARVKTHVNVQTRDPRHARSILTVPMIVGEQVVGTMQMQSYVPGFYSTVDIPLLTGIANQFALALQNAMLYGQIEQELAERKRSEWQRGLLNRILTVFQVEDGDGIYRRVLSILVEATASRCGLFGYVDRNGDLVCPAATCAANEIRATSGGPIQIPGDRWRLLRGDHGAQRSTVINERRIKLPGGEMVFERSLVVPLMQGAETIGILAVANRDGDYDAEQIELLDVMAAQISPVLAARLQRDREQQAREAALEALGEREAQYRMLYAANPVPMWVYDLENYRFLDVNEAAEAQYGYTRGEFLRMRVHDIRPAEELARLEENLHQQRVPFETSGPWRHRKKSGEIILVEISSHTMPWQDRPAVVVQARDVTARVHAERALAASERKFRDLAEQLPGLILILDEAGVRYVNARGAAMLGR
ncbi:MAG: GAF domain-containing protein, partial [Caldilinea sp.]|nr:GAF domain-containing protein [Caldilinea sp.]